MSGLLKCLRGLRQPQPFPGHGFHDPPGSAHLLHGILDRHADGRGAVLIGGGHGAADQFPGDEGPDAVMDEDDPVFIAHMEQGVSHGILSLRSARENPADLGKTVPRNDLAS